MERLGRTAGGAGYILVVDDDDDIRELLDVALSQTKYGVRCVKNVEAALRTFAAETPAAALIDLILPQTSLTSVELAAQLDAHGVPVIMMSGMLGAAETLRKLPYRYLLKPFRIAALSAIVLDAVSGGAATFKPERGGSCVLASR
jgi:two-component system, NtrC family, nitrogen regulation response regulator NtrX